MTAILLFAFFFLSTLTLTSFKKAKFLKDFTVVIKGRVTEVSSTDEGVFLIVEYPVDEEMGIYKHRFSPTKLPEKKLQILVTKFVDSSFYLLGRKDNDKLVEIAAYANVKLFKWLYLIGALIAGYFLFA
jgi:hypothetical protein